MKKKLDFKEIKSLFALESLEIKERLKKKPSVCILGKNSSSGIIRDTFGIDSEYLVYMDFPFDAKKVQAFKKSRIRLVLLDFKNIDCFKSWIDSLKLRAASFLADNYKILVLTEDFDLLRGKDIFPRLKKHKNIKIIDLSIKKKEDIIKDILSFFHGTLVLGHYFKNFKKTASQRIVFNEMRKILILFPDILIIRQLTGLWLKIAAIYNKKLDFEERLVELFNLKILAFLLERQLLKKKYKKTILVMVICAVISFIGSFAIEYFDENFTGERLDGAIKNMADSILASFNFLKLDKDWLNLGGL